MTRRDVMAEKKDDLLRMIRAVARTLTWFDKTPAPEIAKLLGPYFPDLAAELFAQCIDRYRGVRLWATDPLIRREGVERLHACMRSAGMLSRDIPFEACIDTTLAKAALA